ncbi:MAG: hypothetical protein K2Q18_06835 [Bdellovibrionales bacterium]|nr:hypothetical protein [Bdellovibrionales bacterium]
MSKLISETYTEAPLAEEKAPVSDLRNYFEKKLNEVEFNSMSDYLTQHGLKVSAITLMEKTQCYRLIFNKSVLDFPKNWSVFKDIQSSDVIFIDQSLDEDFLLDVFSEVTGEYSHLAFVKDNQQVRLIYLPEEQSRDHVKWFRGYFDKKHHMSILDGLLAESSEELSEEGAA